MRDLSKDNRAMLQKRILHTVALFLGALLLCACPEVDPAGPDGPDGPDEPAGPETPTGDYFRLMINLSTEVPDGYEVVFNSDATGTTFIVQTSLHDWEATAEENWCQVNKDENGNLVVLVPAYGEYRETLAPRHCSVRVKAGSLYDKSFTVVQQSYTYFNFASDLQWNQALFSNVLQMPPSGGTAMVTVVTNSWKWNSETDAGWITTRFVDASTLEVTTSARPSGQAAPRKGTVTLTNIADDFVTASFAVIDSDAVLYGDDYIYGDHSEWD